MTNENKSDFKSYYPRINVTDYLSESGKKMLHDNMIREHEYAEALKREAAVKYCKLWFPLNPNFPENYIRDIVSIAREGYIVLISSHKEVRDELNKRSIPFTIVLPSLDMKQEMIDRYIKRGNQENFVTMLENNYETFVNDLMSDPNNKIVLDSGQYLKDVVRFI